jgi:hypothetical protein
MNIYSILDMKYKNDINFVYEHSAPDVLMFKVALTLMFWYTMIIYLWLFVNLVDSKTLCLANHQNYWVPIYASEFSISH